MSSQNQNLIVKNFSANSTTNTQHIAEFTAQYDGGVYPEGSDNHLGVLFSVQKPVLLQDCFSFDYVSSC